MEEKEEGDAELAEEIVYDDDGTETVSEQDTWSNEESNKMVNGKQCTMAWYVNEIKISHQEVCAQIADIIETRYGKLTRSQGKKHNFLSMDIELLGNKKVAISMPQHLQKACGQPSEQ